MKLSEKQRAISLREEGNTYSEILAKVPVAKSTLSEWLKSVQLATPQKQRLTEKRKNAALRGARARHQHRISEIHTFESNALAEIDNLSSRELWLIGTALYWAEGSKQHPHSPSTGVMFSNSDSRMIQIFLLWLKQIGVPTSAVHFELYVHETRSSEVRSFKHWWSQQLNVSPEVFDKVYFKKGNPKTKRKNILDSYHGLIRVKVASSTTLNRKINGWIYGIVASLGDGVTGNTPAFGAGESRFDP